MATPVYSLSEIVESQASKYITHNEALRLVDAFLGTVLDKDINDPSTLTPNEGDLYIVATSAVGDWLSHDYDLAAYVNGSWRFVTPTIKMRPFYVEDEEFFVRWNGSAWEVLASLNTVAYDGNSDGYIDVNKGGTGADLSAYEGLLNFSGGIANEIRLNLAATSNPTVNDDSNAGYTVGSRWVNVTDNREFVCVDSTVSAALWLETTAAAGGSMTGSQILTELLSVDGTNSGLDADLLDGLDSTALAQLSNNNNFTGNNSFSGKVSYGGEIAVSTSDVVLSGNLDLSSGFTKTHYYLDPDGSNRDVNLPTNPSSGDGAIFVNTGSGNILLKDGSTTIKTLSGGKSTLIIYTDASHWRAS